MPSRSADRDAWLRCRWPDREIGVRTRQFQHGRSRPTQKPALLYAGRQVERVMRDDDPDERRRRGRQTPDDPIHLARVDPPFAVANDRAVLTPITIISSSWYSGSRSGEMNSRYRANGVRNRRATFHSGTS